MSYNTEQIIKINNGKIIFLKDKFDEIISKTDKNKISILTINGALRSGKSFFLNLLLKNMFPDKDFTSFNWAHGKNINTQGMWILSSPIDFDDDTSLIIIDTQGLYDTSLDIKTTTALFSLSTLISSFQIYNIDKRLQEDYLQKLELFAEYAKIVRKTKNNTAPFQHLNILIRDWQFFEGGNISNTLKEAQEYLDDFMSEDKISDNLIKTRKNIKNCFKKVSCALLPHPGFDVSEGNFKNDLNDIRSSFLNNIKYFCDYILSSIESKKIFDRYIHPTELSEYIENYIYILDNNVPEPDTILNMQIRLEHDRLLNESIEIYNKTIGNLILKNVNYEKLKQQHDEIKNKLLNNFKTRALWGDNEYIKNNINKLNNIFEKLFIEYNKLNEIKKKMDLIN